MEEKKTLEIVFEDDEKSLYEMLKQYCEKNGTVPEEYVKVLIKRDLSWGHFTRRKKENKIRKET